MYHCIFFYWRIYISKLESDHGLHRMGSRVASERIEASRGNAESQYQVGSFLLKGLGVELNSKQAAYWFSKAADQEHLKALLQLALLYEEGIGVSKDEYKALLLYKKALENVCKRLQAFCTTKSKALAL